MSCDVSILIVQTFEVRKVRQTIRNIYRAAPQVSFEIIVIDNNPAAGMHAILEKEFPHVRYIALDRNKGFGGGMNEGIRIANGRYILVFNPDIVVEAQSLETLTRFMDAHPDVGVVGPKLVNPNGSLQFSCYRLPPLLWPVYRRTPLGKTAVGKQVIEEYLMTANPHAETQDVDALIGAALFCRRTDLQAIGLFDERFFMYYEDNDLCRRFWERGKRVVYLPSASMIHYHRRASADGSLLQQCFSRFTWIQIASFVRYMQKYFRAPNPRLTYFAFHGGTHQPTNAPSERS
ncbi:MAG: glycosyltransferase family 2 protein [Patescibacteria group bacterium]|jgi:hypothetical protein